MHIMYCYNNRNNIDNKIFTKTLLTRGLHMSVSESTASLHPFAAFTTPFEILPRNVVNTTQFHALVKRPIDT